MKAHLITIATALTLSAVSPAAADQYEGQYGAAGDCAAMGKSATQCWIDIKRSGKGYVVDFVVADRMDASKVVCKQNFKLRHGKVEDAVNRTILDGLVGQHGGNLVSLWSNGTGGITMAGGTNNVFVCQGKFVWSGFYEFFGDY